MSREIDSKLLEVVTESVQSQERLVFELKKRKTTSNVYEQMLDECVAARDKLWSVRAELEGTAVRFNKMSIDIKIAQSLKQLVLMHTTTTMNDKNKEHILDLVKTAFEGQYKRLLYVGLVSCPWYSVAAPSENGIQAKHNQLLITYVGKDDQFFAPVKPSNKEKSSGNDVYEYEGWLYAAEVYHFVHHLMKGKVRFIESLYSPQSAVVFADDNWNELVLLARKYNVVGLSGFLEQCRGQAVGTVGHKKGKEFVVKDSVTLFEFCECFRLLQHATSVVSGATEISMSEPLPTINISSSFPSASCSSSMQCESIPSQLLLVSSHALAMLRQAYSNQLSDRLSNHINKRVGLASSSTADIITSGLTTSDATTAAVSSDLTSSSYVHKSQLFDLVLLWKNLLDQHIATARSNQASLSKPHRPGEKLLIAGENPSVAEENDGFCAANQCKVVKNDEMMAQYVPTSVSDVGQVIGDWLCQVRLSGTYMSVIHQDISDEERLHLNSLISQIEVVPTSVINQIPREQILLVAQAGSHLYGLATSNSDADYVIVYAQDTKRLSSATSPMTECHESRGPSKSVEYGMYEVRLLTEMLWKSSVVILELLSGRRELFVTENAVRQYFGLIKHNMTNIASSKYAGQAREAKLFYQIFHKLDALKYLLRGECPRVKCIGETREFILRIRQGLTTEGEMSREVLYKTVETELTTLREAFNARTNRLPENVNYQFLLDWILNVRGLGPPSPSRLN